MSAASAQPTVAPTSGPTDLAHGSEERPRLAARALTDALLLGVVGDALFRAPTWGANMTVWAFAIMAAMLTLARRRYDGIPRDAKWLTVPALALAITLAWHANDALAVYTVLAFLGTLALIAAAIARGPNETLLDSRLRDLAHNALVFGLSTLLGMIPLALSDVSFRQVAGARTVGRAMTGLRAALVAIPLLLIFGGLFAAADPVFARIVTDLFHLDPETVVSHVVVTGFIAWLVGGLLRATVLSTGRTERGIPFPDGALGLTEVSVALGSLVLLFAAFVVVQLRYFFGGAALVQSTAGLSYADYARKGFFELVTVGALVLPVLLAGNALLRRESPRAQRVFQVLAGTLLWLMFIIMYSALRRMQLYVSVYGLSLDRLFATVFMGWLALVLAWFAVTVLRGRERPFLFGVVTSGWATLITLAAADPAGFVTRFDIARAAEEKSVDVRYLASLGADAAPDLAQFLTRERAGIPAGWIIPGLDVTASADVMPNAFHDAVAPDVPRVADFGERCEAARRLLREWAPETPTDWRGWTLARRSARRAVATHERALRKLAGSLRVGDRPVACPAPRST